MNRIIKTDAIVPKKKKEYTEWVLKNIGTIYIRMNVERTVIDWKEWSGNGLNHLEIIELGEHCRVLIYLYKCKYWTEQNRDGSIGIKINM